MYAIFGVCGRVRIYDFGLTLGSMGCAACGTPRYFEASSANTSCRLSSLTSSIDAPKMKQVIRKEDTIPGMPDNSQCLSFSSTDLLAV